MSKEFFEQRYRMLGGSVKNIRIKNSLRVNFLNYNENKVIENLKRRGVILKRIEEVEHAYFYFADFSMSSTPEFLSGQIYIQDLASMLPVKVLNPKQNERVLDMCASPGSKTTQMSLEMHGKGEIIAVEKNPARLPKLKLNLERQMCRNVKVYFKDVLNFKPRYLFDKILLDAPCSGNYTQEKGWFEKRTLKGIIENSKKQRRLIKKAYSMLKEGGTLVYSTCSLEPEEDELVVDYALKLGFRLEQTNLKIGDSGVNNFGDLKFDKSLKLTKRLWPFKDKTQGFYIAKLVKD